MIKGNLTLEIDEQGIEARVTVLPDPEGAEVSADTVKRLLADKGVREGIDGEGIERAFRTLARKREPLTFSAARGRAPEAAEPESVAFEALDTPADLAATARRILAAAGPPEVFVEREEKVSREKKVSRKAALPFRAPREEVQVVWEKRIVREKLLVDPALAESGYVRKDAVVARVRPATQGAPGRSIFGRPVPADRTEKKDFAFGSGLTRVGTDVRAAVSGFLRRGANWCDVVPYRDNEITLYADGGTCLLSVEPGDPGAAPPVLGRVLSEAERLGFKREALLPEAEIEAMLRQAMSSRTPLVKRPITPSEDALAAVTVSPDRLRATLTLRKGRGAGKKLTLAEAAEAIRKSGVKGFNADIVKKDILAFYNGPQLSLTEYALVVGQPPEKGEDGKIDWLAGFLKREEAERVRQASAANPAGLQGIGSLKEFPLERVESVGRVEKGDEILRIVPPGPGKPGLDVFRGGIAGIKGAEPKVRLLENLKKQRDVVTAGVGGILERGTVDGIVLLRVRPHKDAEAEVTISEDRMRATLSYIPAVGTGKTLNAEEVKEKIEQAGVVQGVRSDALLEALGAISKNLPLKGFCVAEGKPPKGGEGRKIAFHIRLASGSRVSVREDGKADFKNIDTMTQVKKGVRIATLEPGESKPEDGWDVTGRTLSAGTEQGAAWSAGRNVRSEQEPGGLVSFFAEKDGELTTERNTLEVKELHLVPGDVDLNTGNVKFTGKVHVKGAVLSGFTVIAGDDIVIDEVVQASFVSSDGSITVGQGVKGEGRAVLRARRDIRASFAEQAVLISVGDIRLKSGCLRCQIKSNGRLLLESERGNLMGGVARARRGASLQNLGSPGGAHTLLSFGQDYAVKDQIEKAQKEVDALKHRIMELDIRMKKLEKAGSPGRQALEGARTEKLQGLKLLEKASLRLLGLRDKFEEHFPSEVVVRGTLYPGAIVESHGRLFEVKTEKTKIALYFDPAQGRILEKPAK